MTLPDVSKSLAEPPIPSTPFRGIDAFRFSDRGIFFARDDESLNLLRYITIYRGVLLYGESGAGKSSLVEAGILADAISDGLRAREDPSTASWQRRTGCGTYPNSAGFANALASVTFLFH